MSHQVQNHEASASSPDIPDHLDELIIPQVMREANAHSHIGWRQGLPHRVELQYRELSGATLRRPQVYSQYFSSDLFPHFLQQLTVPTAYIQNSPHRLSVTPQRPQHRRMIPQQAVSQGKPSVHPRQHLGV